MCNINIEECWKCHICIYKFIVLAVSGGCKEFSAIISAQKGTSADNPDRKVHGANMGPIWGPQDPGGSHVGPVDLAIWECLDINLRLLNCLQTLIFNDYVFYICETSLLDDSYD